MYLYISFRVDSYFQVKVADFGLSRDLYSRDYYRLEDGQTPLPVRWMAPECLSQNVYTDKSDMVRERHESVYGTEEEEVSKK